MAPPDAAIGEVARTGPPEFRPPERDDGERRPEGQPAEQRLVQPQEQAARPGHALPVAPSHEIRLGVLQRVGQGRAGMVAQVGVAVDLVRHPQAERQPGEREVGARRTGRMSMHRLVLERAVPAGDEGPGRQQQPPGQRRRMEGEQQPAAIDRAGDDPGRPFPAAPRRRSPARISAPLQAIETGFPCRQLLRRPLQAAGTRTGNEGIATQCHIAEQIQKSVENYRQTHHKIHRFCGSGSWTEEKSPACSACASRRRWRGPDCPGRRSRAGRA